MKYNNDWDLNLPADWDVSLDCNNMFQPQAAPYNGGGSSGGYVIMPPQIHNGDVQHASSRFREGRIDSPVFFQQQQQQESYNPQLGLQQTYTPVAKQLQIYHSQLTPQQNYQRAQFATQQQNQYFQPVTLLSQDDEEQNFGFSTHIRAPSSFITPNLLLLTPQQQRMFYRPSHPDAQLSCARQAEMELSYAQQSAENRQIGSGNNFGGLGVDGSMSTAHTMALNTRTNVDDTSGIEGTSGIDDTNTEAMDNTMSSAIDNTMSSAIDNTMIANTPPSVGSTAGFNSLPAVNNSSPSDILPTVNSLEVPNSSPLHDTSTPAIATDPTNTTTPVMVPTSVADATPKIDPSNWIPPPEAQKPFLAFHFAFARHFAGFVPAISSYNSICAANDAKKLTPVELYKAIYRILYCTSLLLFFLNPAHQKLTSPQSPPHSLSYNAGNPSAHHNGTYQSSAINSAAVCKLFTARSRTKRSAIGPSRRRS